MLRALAFLVPYATGTGTFGLGPVVVGGLWVLAVRRSRAAWGALVVLDVGSLGFLLLGQRTSPAPLILPLAAGAALVTLLLPSVWRHVARPRPSRPVRPQRPPRTL